jgi:tetratricopeptide (TPR) repeat protein
MKVTGSLAPIVDLDMRFTRSRNMMGVVLAYYQSTLAVEHMHKRWGWDKLVEALHVYAKGHQTEHVLETVFDIEPAAFDKAFSAFLDERLSHYEGQFDPLAFTVMDPKELEKRAKKAKDAISSKQPSARSKQREDARIVAWLSMLHAIRGKKKEAKAALETAKKLAKNVNHPHVRFAQAFLYRLSGEHEKEKAALQKLVADGHDSYEGRLRLAKLAARSKSYPKVISHLKAATKLDPEASQPLVELAFLYKKLKKKKEVADVITRLAFIKQTSASIVYTAIVRNSRLKRWDRVRKLGPLGIHNQPFNSTIHEKYAWALRAAGKHKEALFEFQSALLCKPRNAEYIHVGIARSYLAMGQTKKALVHVNRALDVSSNFRPAVELLRKLRPL